jgi:hypothetical protein
LKVKIQPLYSDLNPFPLFTLITIVMGIGKKGKKLKDTPSGSNLVAPGATLPSNLEIIAAWNASHPEGGITTSGGGFPPSSPSLPLHGTGICLRGRTPCRGNHGDPHDKGEHGHGLQCPGHVAPVPDHLIVVLSLLARSDYSVEAPPGNVDDLQDRG